MTSKQEITKLQHLVEENSNQIWDFNLKEHSISNQKESIEINIEEVRNKLATETDVNTREELESEQEGFFDQREFGCMERTNW